jgi:uncharacterized DUF497 family protein
VLQVIRCLLTRPECFRLERELAGPDFHRGEQCALARHTEQRHDERYHAFNRREYREIRIQAIGCAGDDILFVAYTDRGDVRHLISARLVNRKERRLWQSFIERWTRSAA